MNNETQIIDSIKDLKEDFHLTIGRVEKKIDNLDCKLEEVNERAITNTVKVVSLENEVDSKTKEFHKMISIVHKVIRNCKVDHEKCPVKVKSDAVMEMKIWFYGTWVVSSLAFIIVLVKDVLFK